MAAGRILVAANMLVLSGVLPLIFVDGAIQFSGFTRSPLVNPREFFVGLGRQTPAPFFVIMFSQSLPFLFAQKGTPLPCPAVPHESGPVGDFAPPLLRTNNRSCHSFLELDGVFLGL